MRGCDPLPAGCWVPLPLRFSGKENVMNATVGLPEEPRPDDFDSAEAYAQAAYAHNPGAGDEVGLSTEEKLTMHSDEWFDHQDVDAGQLENAEIEAQILAARGFEPH